MKIIDLLYALWMIIYPIIIKGFFVSYYYQDRIKEVDTMIGKIILIFTVTLVILLSWIAVYVNFNKYIIKK